MMIIHDINKVHNLAVARYLSGIKTVYPDVIANRFGWEADRTLNAICLTNALAPGFLHPKFNAECEKCKFHTSVDNYIKEINTNGTYVVQCEGCKIPFKVMIDNMKPYFIIQDGFVTGKVDFI